MSGLSHWHDFVVLMLPFGYTTVYSPCCCESHDSHPFLSFNSLVHETRDLDKNLFQVFVVLLNRQRSSGLNSSNEITYNLGFENFLLY